MSEKKKVCMLCGKESVESICESCKGNVQGEAAHRKKQIDKQVKSGADAETDRRIKKQLED